MGVGLASFAEMIGRLDASSQQPLYQQLQRSLRDAISGKALAADDALPPERDLAEQFAVSRITVRKALDGLVEEGLLTRRQGSGTFVAGQRVEKNFSKLSSFTEDMAARGRTAHSVWLSKSEGRVTPEEALTLGLGPHAAVYRFARIRYADDAPMALEYSTIPADCLPSVDAVEESLYVALEKAKCRPARALQRLRAVLFSEGQAELLKVRARDAGLFIERRGELESGKVVEFTQSYYRGDAYDFVAELNVGT
jgi:GntR family transcriptional regulator